MCSQIIEFCHDHECSKTREICHDILMSILIDQATYPMSLPIQPSDLPSLAALAAPTPTRAAFDAHSLPPHGYVRHRGQTRGIALSRPCKHHHLPPHIMMMLMREQRHMSMNTLPGCMDTYSTGVKRAILTARFSLQVVPPTLTTTHQSKNNECVGYNAGLPSS
jgi:hypothetical protein